MSDKYPNNWYHGHKHILQALNHARNGVDSIETQTVREELFGIEIDVTFGPGTTATDIHVLHGRLIDVGFSERPDAHPDDPMTHRYEWEWDEY